MKKILFISSLYFLCAYTFQKQAIPKDDSGKYTIMGVIEVPGLKKEDLYKTGKEFMSKIRIPNSREKYLTENEEKSLLINKGAFTVHRPGSLKKHPDGVVFYDIRLEFKDGKYRYAITNFLFKEYRRNRYGKYEPVKDKPIPLETDPSGLNKKTWDNYRKAVLTKSMALIENMEKEITDRNLPETKNATDDENW